MNFFNFYTNCREEIETANRRINIFYSNPQIPKKEFMTTYFNEHITRENMKIDEEEKMKQIIIAIENIKPLQTFSREMRYVVSLLNPFDFFMQPATTINNFSFVLSQYLPQIIIWCGHTMNGNLLFENENGYFDKNSIITKEKFEICLKESSKLKLLILMGCSTNKIAEHLHSKTKIIVIYWSTIVEDNAAADFMRGIIDFLQINRDKEINVQYAHNLFRSGLLEFYKKKHKIESGGKPEILPHQ